MQVRCVSGNTNQRSWFSMGRSFCSACVVAITTIGGMAGTEAATKTFSAQGDLLAQGVRTVQQQDIQGGILAVLRDSAGNTVAALTTQNSISDKTITWSEGGTDLLRITMSNDRLRYGVVDLLTGQTASASFDETLGMWVTAGPMTEILSANQTRMLKVMLSIDFLVLGVPTQDAIPRPLAPTVVDGEGWDGTGGGGNCGGNGCWKQSIAYLRSDACRVARWETSYCCITPNCYGCCDMRECDCVCLAGDYFCSCHASGTSCNE